MKFVILVGLLFVASCVAPQKQVVVEYRYVTSKSTERLIDELRGELDMCKKRLIERHAESSPRIIYLDIASEIEKSKTQNEKAE